MWYLTQCSLITRSLRDIGTCMNSWRNLAVPLMLSLFLSAFLLHSAHRNAFPFSRAFLMIVFRHFFFLRCSTRHSSPTIVPMMNIFPPGNIILYTVVNRKSRNSSTNLLFFTSLFSSGSSAITLCFLRPRSDHPFDTVSIEAPLVSSKYDCFHFLFLFDCIHLVSSSVGARTQYTSLIIWLVSNSILSLPIEISPSHLDERYIRSYGSPMIHSQYIRSRNMLINTLVVLACHLGAIKFTSIHCWYAWSMSVCNEHHSMTFPLCVFQWEKNVSIKKSVS